MGGFRLDSIDGERWAEALAEIEWLFEEADGAAIGRLRDGTGAFVFVDNEGQFKIQRTLVDHFAWEGPRSFAAKRARSAREEARVRAAVVGEMCERGRRHTDA